MGTAFFRGQDPRVAQANPELYMMGRQANADITAGRNAAYAAQKDVAGAQALGRAKSAPLQFLPGRGGR